MTSLVLGTLFLLASFQSALTALADIDPKTLDNVMIKDKDFFVLFYDPRCAHCKEVTPRIDVIQANWTFKRVKIYRVNCRDYPAEIMRWRFSFFPAFIHFHEK